MQKLILAIVVACTWQLSYAASSIDTLKARAAQGDPVAETELAERYYRGEGVEANPREAVSWWKKAAQQNHAPAMLALGRAYYNGTSTGTGVDEDFVQAWIWFKLAARAGDGSAAQDAARAEAELSPARLNEGRVRLAEMLLQGQAGPKDPRLAVQLYQAAVQSGSLEARIPLVKLYLTGEFLPRDTAAGAAICDLMNSDRPEAFYCRALVERAGPAPDWKKVVTLYQRAINTIPGFGPLPLVELADLYAEGIHVQRDDVRAIVMYAVAMNQLSPGGAGLLTSVMDPERMRAVVVDKIRLLDGRMSTADREAAKKAVRDPRQVRKLLR